MSMKYIRNQHGVTLIELLAVVIILGIIAAIAAPAVIGSFDNAKTNADAQTREIIRDAAKRYVMDQVKSKKLQDINQTKTDDLSFLNGYLDNLDSNNRIKSAEDPNKTFHVEITNGNVSVTIEQASSTS